MLARWPLGIDPSSVLSCQTHSTSLESLAQCQACVARMPHRPTHVALSAKHCIWGVGLFIPSPFPVPCRYIFFARCWQLHLFYLALVAISPSPTLAAILAFAATYISVIWHLLIYLHYLVLAAISVIWRWQLYLLSATGSLISVIWPWYL